MSKLILARLATLPLAYPTVTAEQKAGLHAALEELTGQKPRPTTKKLALRRLQRLLSISNWCLAVAVCLCSTDPTDSHLLGADIFTAYGRKSHAMFY
nr:hypothetical protein [Lacticaseibacillus camelliae]